MSSSKKLALAAAILTAGLCLALLFAAPRASYVPSGALYIAPSRELQALPQSTTSAVAIDSARLVPDARPEFLQPPELPQTPTGTGLTVEPPALETPTEVLEQPQAPAHPLGRLVGIQSKPSGGTSAACPSTRSVSLPQVSVQVSTVKPVYATVEYPEVITTASVAENRVPQANLPQDAPVGSLDEAGSPASIDVGPWADEAVPNSLRTHIVIDGDSLARLAARYLDDPQQGEEIFQLNQGVLTDPELLPIGLELKIPPRPLRPVPPVGGVSRLGDSTEADRGLVPVYEIPAASGGAPRAKLLRPMPAAYPSHQP